jgi:hypothetical protein
VAVDLQPVPGLVCGQTYHNAESEARLPSLRQDEEPNYGGCGQMMAWVHTYRCRQCGRWMHGECLDRHFADDQEDD